MVKNNIDIDELRKMAESGEYSTNDMATHFFCSVDVIRKRMAKHGIRCKYRPKKGRYPRREIPTDGILQLRDQGLSYTEIGKRYGCASSTIIAKLKIAGIFKTQKRGNSVDQVQDKDIAEMLAAAAAYDQRLKRSGLLK